MSFKPGSDSRYLQFSLGQELYAIPLLRVREVIAVPNTTAVPNTPDYFVGIMNLRGQVITIVDLRKRLKITPKTVGLEEAVVILDMSRVFIGVVVDSVNKVLNLAEDQIQTQLETETQIKTDYIIGVTRDESQDLTVLIDVQSLFNFKNLNKFQDNIKLGA